MGHQSAAVVIVLDSLGFEGVQELASDLVLVFFRVARGQKQGVLQEFRRCHVALASEEVGYHVSGLHGVVARARAGHQLTRKLQPQLAGRVQASQGHEFDFPQASRVVFDVVHLFSCPADQHDPRPTVFHVVRDGGRAESRIQHGRTHLSRLRSGLQGRHRHGAVLRVDFFGRAVLGSLQHESGNSVPHSKK